MITCPVCEHTQAGGDECEQCGKRFTVRAAAGPVNVPRLAELEPTPHAGGAAEVRAEPIPELESTRVRQGPDLPPLSFPEIELTRQPDGGDADGPPLPDLELGRAPDDGVRTEVPWGAVKCRYCGHEQAEGRLCDRCGMRLPRFGPDGAAAPAAEAAAVDDGLRVRCKCGSPARPGQRCVNCGEVVAFPEA
ncbi:MAG TPA: hypothetical protein VFB81_21215 [Myxococcales bacterium]|nr:hypothetical protein [Myxococcales bacterium]